jgi:carbohydrate kinase (thermoresistant glucokinase family)
MTAPILQVVVMGVAGSGKSTIGAALAARLGAEFVDGDDLHPPHNIALMREGIPLTDRDRWPWLARVGETLAGATGSIVVACSALARRYRDAIRAEAPDARFVHLTGPRDVLYARLANRSGHYMAPSMLESQLAVLEPLEPDEAGITVEITSDPDRVVSAALRYLQEPT